MPALASRPDRPERRMGAGARRRSARETGGRLRGSKPRRLTPDRAKRSITPSGVRSSHVARRLPSLGDRPFGKTGSMVINRLTARPMCLDVCPVVSPGLVHPARTRCSSGPDGGLRGGAVSGSPTGERMGWTTSRVFPRIHNGRGAGRVSRTLTGAKPVILSEACHPERSVSS
jgi:hypothetical protein